jgi:copper chaperone
METVVLKISGMTCGGCVNSVRRVINAIDGVVAVNVSLESAQAVIDYDGAKTKPEEFKTAIRDAGFETG